MGIAAAKRRGRPNLKVFWPLDDPLPRPKKSGGGGETVRNYGRIDGFPLRVHLWDGSDRPADADAVYVPERNLWLAVRIG